VLRECKERRLRKLQKDEADIDEKFQLGGNRVCDQEKCCEFDERNFHLDDNNEKFQLGGKRVCKEEERGSGGWRRLWSNEEEKKGWSQQRNQEGSKLGWSQQRNREGSKEGWRHRDRGALGFFLCPVCLATHLVPRSAFSLLPRVPSLPLRPLSLVSYQSPLSSSALGQRERRVFSYCESSAHSRMDDGDDRDLGELCRRLRTLLQEDTPVGGLLQAVTKLEKLSVTLSEENFLRTSSPILRSLSSPSPPQVEALVESPLYERVNCRVRLLVDCGSSSWDGQGLTATLTLRRGGEIALVPGTQVSFQEGHWGFFLVPPWPGVGEVTVALRGFTARGSPYTVRVLALKLEEEGDGTEEIETHHNGVEQVSI